jgi:phospho-N-acetylmuramoyl-pentapeptide-transferase
MGNGTIIIREGLILPQIIKVFSLSFLSFAVAMALTPVFTYFAYKYQWWKKLKTEDMEGKSIPVFKKLHAEKHKRNIPTMAGIVIWTSIAIVTLLFNLDRAQTWLPLFTLVTIGCLGLIDDYVNIRSTGGVAGVKAKLKMGWLLLFSGIGAWWFYYKLGWTIIHIPAYGDVTLGWLYIPFFIAVVVSTANAVNITDGLDGLSGGLLSAAFSAFAFISFFNGHYGLAAFCGAVVGAVLAYTWFNIYPARFFMGDTGAVALGATLGVVALLNNDALVLPIIGFVFVVETLSSMIQIASKK